MKRYPKEFKENTLARDLELEEAELEMMTRNEVFDMIMSYEGFGQYSGYLIRATVKNVYGIDLDHYEEYLDENTLAEMDGLDE